MNNDEKWQAYLEELVTQSKIATDSAQQYRTTTQQPIAEKQVTHGAGFEAWLSVLGIIALIYLIGEYVINTVTRE